MGEAIDSRQDLQERGRTDSDSVPKLDGPVNEAGQNTQIRTMSEPNSGAKLLVTQIPTTIEKQGQNGNAAGSQRFLDELQTEKEIEKTIASIPTDDRWHEFTKPDGSKARIFKHTNGQHCEISKNADGSTSIRVRRPGQAKDIFIEASKEDQLTVDSDGTFKIRKNDGTIITSQTDGSIVTEYRNGEKEILKADSNRTSEKGAPAPNWQSDGKGKFILTKQDGAKYEVVQNKDNISVRMGQFNFTIHEGGQTRILPDGSLEITLSANSDYGNTIRFFTDGSYEQKYKDGGRVVTSVDKNGTVKAFGKDGTITTRWKDGTVRFANQPNGETTTMWNGVSETVRKDGSKLTYWDDARKVRRETPYRDKNDGHIIGYHVKEEGPKPEDNKTYESGDQLAAEKAKLLAHLIDTFHVNFSTDADGSFNYLGKTLQCRAPTYGELLAVEQALLKSQPSQLTANGTGIRFVFTDGPEVPQAAGQYHSGVIYITPKAEAFNPSDTIPGPVADFQSVGGGHLVALLMHEISHHSDHKMNPRAFAGEEAVVKELESKFGFSRIVDRYDPEDPRDPNRERWVMLDRQGNKYKKVKDGWVKCDNDGRQLDKPITTGQMRSIAAVTPVSRYFIEPHEMFAEALTAYRLGGAWRDRLQNECPALFRLAQEHDQRERAYHAGFGWVQAT